MLARADAPGEQTPHAPGQRTLARAHEQVRMIGEQGPGIDRPGLEFCQAGRAGEKVGAAPIVAEEGGALNPAHHDVVEGGRGIEPRLAGHDYGLVPPWARPSGFTGGLDAARAHEAQISTDR